ncbi:Clp protease N-terminal domain-containing protein [Amycolatopsis ultiminotia]|uniref:Clp protease N-terminal domain-containing protein n=1 Tax=Amycolatopsis ultiminotia TaxID=543629 RepID=A0ABP6V2Z4_9PSEU
MTVPAATPESRIARVRSGLESAAALDRPAVAVDLAGHLDELGENLIGCFVDEARNDGGSWAELGSRLGVGRQAVQKRFIPGAVAMLGRGQDGFWERVTGELKEVVRLAGTAAQARRVTYLGTEHLLLGLAEHPEGRAAKALTGCGADPATIRAAIDGRIGVPRGEPLPDETPFTRLALRSLQHALREGLLMNETLIGGEHLALGMITVGEGLAHDVLVNLGVSYESLRADITSLGAPE